MIKSTYEDALTFIENRLGIELLDCQKDLLKKMFESETYYFLPSRFCGQRLYLENLKLLINLSTDVFDMDASIIVNEMSDGEITDFKIKSVSILKKGE